MVSGAWCSGLSLLSSLKSIGWKAKRVGLSEEAGAAGFALAAESDCERASLGALASANRIPNNKQRERLLIMMEAALPAYSILLRQFLFAGYREVRISVGSRRAGLTSANCDQVVAGRDHVITCGIYIAQVTG